MRFFLYKSQIDIQHSNSIFNINSKFSSIEKFINTIIDLEIISQDHLRLLDSRKTIPYSRISEF